MDLYFLDAGGHVFVVPDAPDGYTRADALRLPEPPSPNFRWVNGAWVSPPASPPVALVTYKADVWRRATNEQAAIIDTELTKLDVRMRRLWDDSTALYHDAPEFQLLFQTMANAFTEEEAARILAPSDG